jgi:hypothetical protein
MPLKKTRFRKGVVIAPDTDPLEGVEGEIKVDFSDNRIKATLGAAPREVTTNDQSQTLSNKTLTSPVINTGVSGSAIDTDVTLAANSDTLLASQKAIKAYVTAVAGAQNEASEIIVIPAGTISSTNVQLALQELDTDIQNHLGDTVGAHAATAISNAPTGNLAAITVQAALDEHQGDIDGINSTVSTHLSASTNVHGLAVGSAVVGTSDSQVLTNKTITGADIRTPVRSDVKQDTLSNLVTYALTASNGQIVYATDEKSMYQVVDTELVGIGGAGIVKLTAGETIAAFDLVYISTGTGNDSGRTAGRLYKVDASNDDRNEVLGFAPKAITSGNIGEAQVSGNLKGFTGLTPGKVYYASASVPGAITLTPPSTNAQWVIAVCLASTATEVVINPVSSASAIYVVDGSTSFTVANNQAAAASVTSLLIDGVSTRSFIIDYSVYRQTDTALSALAQAGQLRGVFNTQSSTWFMSDDYSGQNSGVAFSILSSGQIQYTSSNIAGANYVGSMKYAIRKTFGV